MVGLFRSRASARQHESEHVRLQVCRVFRVKLRRQQGNLVKAAVFFGWRGVSLVWNACRVLESDVGSSCATRRKSSAGHGPGDAGRQCRDKDAASPVGLVPCS